MLNKVFISSVFVIIAIVCVFYNISGIFTEEVITEVIEEETEIEDVSEYSASECSVPPPIKPHIEKVSFKDDTEEYAVAEIEEEIVVYEKIIEDVDYINQNDDFPTGCESVSAVMALNYLGIDISVDDFIDNYLDRGNAPYTTSSGVTYACDPWEAFVGNPRSTGGYGCYNTVIENAINKFIDEYEYTVSAEIGLSLDYLCETYIDNDIPVLLWVSTGMKTIYKATEWIIEGTGEYFQWLSPMHCMLLVGYDEDNYYFNDPLTSEYVTYSKSSTLTAYTGMGSQSLVITPTI